MKLVALTEGKSSHGLRKLAGSRLTEAGGSEKEIMAVLGLSSLKAAHGGNNDVFRELVGAEGLEPPTRPL